MDSFGQISLNQKSLLTVPVKCVFTSFVRVQYLMQSQYSVFALHKTLFILQIFILFHRGSSITLFLSSGSLSRRIEFLFVSIAFVKLCTHGLYRLASHGSTYHTDLKCMFGVKFQEFRSLHSFVQPKNSYFPAHNQGTGQVGGGMIQEKKG